MNTENLHWFKSSFTNDPGGNCVEVAYVWPESTSSNDPPPEEVAVRDSKNRHKGMLRVPHKSFGTFVAGIKQGDFT